MMNRLLPFILCIVSVGLFFVYTRPTYTGPITDAKVQIESYESALLAAERFASKEIELTQTRAAIPPESLARLQAFLPDGVDNVQLILDLNALAARSGITLSNFDIKTPTPQSPSQSNTQNPSGSQNQGSPLESSNPLDSIDLTMNATGTYASFRGFLNGIETSLRPLHVVNLDIQESKTGVYTYEMTVRIYWLH